MRSFFGPVVHAMSLMILLSFLSFCSGLGIGDQTKISDQEDIIREEPNLRSASPVLSGPHINPGWGGKGLHGCHSAASLTRTMSNGSGLFIEEEEEDADEANDGDQAPGELSSLEHRPHKLAATTSEERRDHEYFKTTNMANFYYRKSGSHDNLRSKSHDHLLAERDERREEGMHERKRSSSAAALNRVTNADLLNMKADDMN